MKRFPNGFGTIEVLPGNRRKKYAARACVRFNEYGKQERPYIGYFETREEAYEALILYNKNNPPKEVIKQNSFNKIFEEFMEYKKTLISASTYSSYKYSYNYLKEYKNRSIQDIKFMELQRTIRNCQKSYSTKKQIKVLLKHIYSFAIINGINVIDNTHLLTLGDNEAIVERIPFNNDEIKLLFKNISKINNVDLVLIMIYTGLRSTEFLNIKIENINLEKRFMIGGGKTRAGTNRCIAISKKILPLIKNRIGDRKEGYLIEIDGKPIKYPKLNSIFKEIMFKLSLNHLPHDTRHTFATLLSSADANTASISKMMGHSSYDITQKIYTHKEIEDFINAVDKL